MNNFDSPLATMDEKKKEINNGFSFDSKKVAVAPMFFNLRIMCDCLGRALRRHIDFSQKYQSSSKDKQNSDFDNDSIFWFLDQLTDAKIEAMKVRKNLKKEILKATGAEIGQKLDESGGTEATDTTDMTQFSYEFKDNLKIQFP